MKEKLAILAPLLLIGCLDMPPKPKYVPPPSFKDFEARETCLYNKVCSEIPKRGTSPLGLEGAAEYASAICEQPIALKMARHAASIGGYSTMNQEITDEHIDRMQLEQHALVVAQQLKTQCATPHG